ncbi:MAG: PIN domain-containing protein [Bryobacterales bacterium]|nr:PIN domain-containing protein [Bryobacterales bacterium]
MKAFFDTSVLVAVFFEQHEHHERSLNVVSKGSKNSRVCAAHTLAEVYAVLTRMPGANRVSGEQALLFLQGLSEELTVIALDGSEYMQCLDSCASMGIVGGSTYDALLAHCALKARADAIYTWNLRHYSLFGADVSKRLRTP